MTCIRLFDIFREFSVFSRYFECLQNLAEITKFQLISICISSQLMRFYVEIKNTLKKLKNIEDIGFIELDNRDVVRHEVVRKIINAYEEKNRN